MKCLVFVLCLSFSLSVGATELVGALSAGQGGTGRAAVEPSESLYLNPASISLMDKFYTALSYQSGFVDKDISRNIYSITFADATKGAIIPGSMGYRRHRISDGGFHYKEDEFKAGVGYRITDRFSFGLGGAYLKGESQIGKRTEQFNMDAGFLFGLQPDWGLSLSGENLLNPKSDVPEALQRVSRVALGTQYVFDHKLTFRYETLMPLHTENTDLLGHRFGIGIVMKGGFVLHGGYSVDDNRQQNWSSLGLAWKGPRLKMAYSMQTEDRSGLGTRHLVDLWVDI